MAFLNVTTIPVGVAVGTGHAWKETVVQHIVVASKQGPWMAIDRWLRLGKDRKELVHVTLCGEQMLMLPSTWQKHRPCIKCKNKRGDIDWGERDNLHVALSTEPLYATAFWPDDWREQAKAYALHTIEHSDVKGLCRRIALGLGYDPPDKILDDYPHYAKKITYIRRPKGAV